MESYSTDSYDRGKGISKTVKLALRTGEWPLKEHSINKIEWKLQFFMHHKNNFVVFKTNAKGLLQKE